MQGLILSNPKGKSPEKSAAQSAEKVIRREAARVRVLSGSIGALSIDTCIFTDAGYRLESGIFKTLEQFKDSDFRLVFSEVTISEVHRHMARQADEDKTALISKLRSFGKSWLLPKDDQEKTANALTGDRTGRTVATERIKTFSKRSGLAIVTAKKSLDVDALLKAYFRTKAPFEGAADKKSEFPDAIALLSLEGWAKQNNTSLLFVSKDKGCQAFCLESERLVAIDELDDALALIQERQKAITLALCVKAEALFDHDEEGALLDDLRSSIEANIWDINWTPQAESADYFEPEILEIEVLGIDFLQSGERPYFRAVEHSTTELVAQALVKVEFEASCNFSFSTRDGIDKDMVPIGDATVTKRAHAELEVLLSFGIDEDGWVHFESAELVSSRQTIDFGFVEPDYSNEDPNADYY
jgi:hypothetical protein